MTGTPLPEALQSPSVPVVHELARLPRSVGVWAQAWKRLKTDRVGMVSLGVTLLFIALVLLAQLGLVGKNWQQEVGTPFAPPHFVGKITDSSQTAVVDRIEGAAVDMSDVDPLAPRYQEWSERAAKLLS